MELLNLSKRLIDINENSSIPQFKRKNTSLINTRQTSISNLQRGEKKVYSGNSVSERNKLEEKYNSKYIESPDLSSLVSYVGNKNAPYLNLYRYKEAFSYQLVDVILREYGCDDSVVFDPFAGMGTTLFTAAANDIEAYGVDRLPLSVFITNAMNDAVLIDADEVEDTYQRLKKNIGDFEEADIAEDVAILQKVIPEKQLSKLKKWKSGIDSIENGKIKNTLKMLFLSILIDSSYAKNAGQFLRVDKDKEIGEPKNLLDNKINKFKLSKKSRIPSEKMTYFEKNEAFVGDSRDVSIDIPEPNMVITSPPYPNRYDYTRSYSLELAFDFVDSNDDLIELRHNLLRSHIESKIEDDYVDSVHPAVREVVNKLEKKDLNNNKIPDMLIGYFYDMEKTFNSLSDLMAKESKIFLVVDNVRYEGEVIPVDLIISETAEKFGFELNDLLITRYKGNSSQQMDEYDRVPVRESVLYLERK